ncbi:MAG: hypothetical protein IJK56_10775, partial [Firmicutes bacterium]|nr:hypothetical protein [Bacillota bacterium]
MAFTIILISLSACRTAEQAASDPETEAQSSDSYAYTAEPDGGKETVVSQTDTSKTSGVFDFESRTVLLNSGYAMPILGLGTYALDHDTCVSSVMALLENGGRLIDTAYMYGNEEAVGEGVRRGMEEYGIPREEI